MRRATIDIGSNSVLLLVAELREGVWQPVFESSEVTALGEGTKASGLLSEAGMARTLKALGHAFGAAREHGAERVLAAATMAARIASNTAEFQARAEAQGTPVIVLSGEDEAELGFRAVADDPAFGQHQRISIIDVGGQSTELVTADRTGEGWDVRFRRSYPMGTLALRGGVMASERLDFPEIMQASREIDDTIGLIYLPQQCGHCVALGATGTNLITIRERIAEWDPDRVHGAYLDYEEVSKAVGWMSRMSDAERASIVGMERGREKTIHIGALILERFLHAARALGCSVSIRGWRHALLERM